jgi:hypothetical protein
MKDVARFSAVVTLLALALSSPPARADMPSFASYLSGTWTCTSQAGSNIVKVYGASSAVDSLDLWNSYVTSRGFAASITEHYTQQGAAVTVVAQLAPGATYVASSPGFMGDKLVFSGTQTFPQGMRFERMTYTRTDPNHFTRVFEGGPSADGPLTVLSSEVCTRLSSAPVPTPAPPHQ